ncbi:MAG: hypothetical protein HRU19_06745 [Pseudobacteriovorax sp.]|nr:hypothetical protein [Pseudobacteriovorax sp.]
MKKPYIAFSLFFTLFLSSCQSYRLQYIEDFYIENGKEEVGPYRYLYEETFERGWFPFACGLTAFFYGGACWLYFTTNANHVRKLEYNAEENLNRILGDTEPLLSWKNYRNVRTRQVAQPPRLRIYDPEGNTLIRGEAENLSPLDPEKLFPEGTVIQDVSDSVHEPAPESEDTESEEMPPLQNTKEPSIYDESYNYMALHLGLLSGSAIVKSRAEDETGSYDVASGSNQAQLWELRIRNLPPNGFYWSFSPSLSRQRLTIKDFESNIPLIDTETSVDIPVVISDPRTEQTIEQFKNSYILTIERIGLLIGAGYSTHFKLKEQVDKSFFSFDGGAWVSSIDYFRNKVEFQTMEVERSSFQFLSGFRFEGNGYINFPKQKLALGAHI